MALGWGLWCDQLPATAVYDPGASTFFCGLFRLDDGPTTALTRLEHQWKKRTVGSSGQ